MSNFDNKKRDLVWNNYIDTVKSKIDDNTVFCNDPGDLGKKFSSKLENFVSTNLEYLKGNQYSYKSIYPEWKDATKYWD